MDWLPPVCQEWLVSMLQPDTSHSTDPSQFTSLFLPTVARSAAAYLLGFGLTNTDTVFSALFGKCFDSPHEVPRTVRIEWISRMLSNVNCTWMMQGIIREFRR
jgi:hypothetical protein